MYTFKYRHLKNSTMSEGGIFTKIYDPDHVIQSRGSGVYRW